MNPFLSDILAQPRVLQEVLEHSLQEERQTIETAAVQIAQAPRVVLTSMGSAYYSLMPLAYALAKLHPNVHLIETSELIRQPFFPQTLYVIMSRSGESGEIAAFAQQLHERGERLLAITMTPDSTLSRFASLTVFDPAPYDGFICTKAYSTMALIGLLIASQLEKSLTPELTSSLHQAFTWMQETQEAFQQQIAQIPWLGQSLTFLSRGVGLGLAQSGVLWTEEAARIRASYGSIDGFLHGPVEQVDENFYGVWLDLLPDTLSTHQYEKMRTRGGNWLTIVPEQAYPGEIQLPTFALPESYRFLLATIPIQLIAYQSATNRGLEAGDMRYTGWVVK